MPRNFLWTHCFVRGLRDPPCLQETSVRMGAASPLLKFKPAVQASWSFIIGNGLVSTSCTWSRPPRASIDTVVAYLRCTRMSRLKRQILNPIPENSRSFSVFESTRTIGPQQSSLPAIYTPGPGTGYKTPMKFRIFTTTSESPASMLLVIMCTASLRAGSSKDGTHIGLNSTARR